MHLLDLLAPARVVAGANATSKKRLLETLAHVLADDTGIEHERTLFDALCSRERMGSTGLGHGVAIPHGRSAALTGAVGAFIRLSDPVDFGSPDGEPVDLIFALAVPEHFSQQHLVLLSQLAEMFGDEPFRLRLRDSKLDSASMYQLLSQWRPGQPAAA